MPMLTSLLLLLYYYILFLFSSFSMCVDFVVTARCALSLILTRIALMHVWIVLQIAVRLLFVVRIDRKDEE